MALGYTGRCASQNVSNGNYKRISNWNDAHAKVFREKWIEAYNLLRNVSNKMEGWIDGFTDT